MSRLHKLLMTPILEVEYVYVRGVDFIGTFVSSYGYKYIFVALDNVSKWFGLFLRQIMMGSVSHFLKKNIFSRFGTPRYIISNGGSHFGQKVFNAFHTKYKLNY